MCETFEIFTILLIAEDFHSEWSEDRAISGMSEEMIEERDEVEVKREDTKTDKNENGAKVRYCHISFIYCNNYQGDIPSSSSLSAPLTAKTKRITKKVVEVKKVEERPKKVSIHIIFVLLCSSFFVI